MATTNEEESAKILALAERTFQTVLAADEHEDGKAGRILSAMAFLTIASVNIFWNARSVVRETQPLILTVPHQSSWETTLVIWLKNLLAIPARFRPLGVEPSTVMFSAFIVLVLASAAFYLSALGPTLNTPAWLWPRRRGGQSAGSASLLFFDQIAKKDEREWKQIWTRAPHVLERTMLENLILESWLIADKTRAKVKLMQLGTLCFKLSLYPLIALTARFLASTPKALAFCTWFGVGLLTSASAFSPWFVPPPNGRWFAKTLWSLAAACTAAAVLAILVF